MRTSEEKTPVNVNDVFISVYILNIDILLTYIFIDMSGTLQAFFEMSRHAVDLRPTDLGTSLHTAQLCFG